MAMNIKLGAALLASCGLAACAPIAYNHGEALAYNKAVQTIDPTPTYGPDDAQPGDNAERAVTAVEAYRERPAGQIGQGGMQGGMQGGQSGGGLGGLGAATGPR